MVSVLRAGQAQPLTYIPSTAVCFAVFQAVNGHYFSSALTIDAATCSASTAEPSGLKWTFFGR